MSHYPDTETLEPILDNFTIDSDKSEAAEVSKTEIGTPKDELYFWAEPGVCG